MRRCFLIGHRDTSEEIVPFFRLEIERHITQYGVKEFVVGHHGKFDALAARCLKEAKKLHPDIFLTQLLVYHPSDRSTVLWDGFDRSVYPDGMERVPPRLAIARANRALVNQSDYLIAYVWQSASNARKIMEYAEKRGVRITNLANYEKRENASQ